MRLERRTREHIIADLGINHVERQVLLAGYTVERIRDDDGIDLELFTFDENGETEPGTVLIQVRSSLELTRSADGTLIRVRVERAHLRRWIAEAVPVLLVVYGATEDRAWWVELHEFAASFNRSLVSMSKTSTIQIPVTNEWTPDAVRRLREVKFRNWQILWTVADDAHE